MASSMSHRSSNNPGFFSSNQFCPFSRQPPVTWEVGERKERKGLVSSWTSHMRRMHSGRKIIPPHMIRIDLNIRWGSSGFMPLAPWSTKWTGRKTISCAQVTRNKDSARETVRKVEALRAFAAGGGRKQDNGRIVLQIFSELRVLDSCGVSEIHRVRLKWKEIPQRRKRTSLPSNIGIGV